MTDQTPPTRDELMRSPRRDLVDTILSHIPHLDLLRGELAHAEIRAARLEEQLHELRVYADHADWRERQIRELLDVTEDREMPGECWVVAKEIRAVYAGGPTKRAPELERATDDPSGVGEQTRQVSDLEPMYAAVYDVIRRYPPRSIDGAHENARVWRAVEAAYDAMVPIIELATTERIAPRLLAGLEDLEGYGDAGILVRPADVEELIHSILVTAPSE